MNTMTNKIIGEIAAAWSEAKFPVVFTGAGMSTESGLPDFRSAKGLWKQRPESLATLEAQQQIPDGFCFFYQWRIDELGKVESNAGHKILAQFEQNGKLQAVITQNVDGLHQRAGSKNVTELHGTLRTVSCLQCGASFPSAVLVPDLS